MCRIHIDGKVLKGEFNFLVNECKLFHLYHFKVTMQGIPVNTHYIFSSNFLTHALQHQMQKIFIAFLTTVLLQNLNFFVLTKV